MAVSCGIASSVLVTLGWNGYSALRPRPDARPTRAHGCRAVRRHRHELYAPYGLRSVAQWYSLYLRRYVDQHGVQPEDAAAVALAFRRHAS